MKTFIYKGVKSNPNNYILNRLMQTYPELVTEDILKSNMDNKGYWYNKPYTNNSFILLPKDCYTDCVYCPYNNKNFFNYASKFEEALMRLNQYAKNKYGYDQLYDFELADGTPVKEYNNFIQVGYRIIPKNDYRGYYSSLSSREKTVINNIVIVINNTINADLNL